MMEPRLDNKDRRVWEQWWVTAHLHSKTLGYQRKVEKAKRIASECLDRYPNSAVMWSGGKDSTALSHLIVKDLGCSDLPLVSEKDDLDYPGEEEYVLRLSSSWGANLRIVRPKVSPGKWIEEHAQELSAGSDFHSRAAALSKECFYGVVEEENKNRDLVFLGLRAEESKGRSLNFITRGHVYAKQPTRWNPSGISVAQPLAEWRGIDVYAYLAANGVEPFISYRCVGFMHARKPWMVRKSWWIPGHTSRNGGVAWIRRYWPSLYRKLNTWLTDANFFT